MKNLIRVISLTLSFFISQSAFAGAQVYHDNWNTPETCFDWSSGGNTYIYCYADKGVWHVTNTPSGNAIYHSKYSSDYTLDYDFNGYMYKETGAYDQKTNYLFKDGQAHVIKDRNTQVIEGSDNTGYCFILSWDSEYQFVNGEVIKNDSNFTFDPC